MAIESARAVSESKKLAADKAVATAKEDDKKARKKKNQPAKAETKKTTSNNNSGGNDNNAVRGSNGGNAALFGPPTQKSAANPAPAISSGLAASARQFSAVGSSPIEFLSQPPPVLAFSSPQQQQSQHMFLWEERPHVVESPLSSLFGPLFGNKKSTFFPCVFLTLGLTLRWRRYGSGCCWWDGQWR